MADVEIEFTRSGGFMYRPGQVIARGNAAIAFVEARVGSPAAATERGDAARFDDVSDPLEIVDEGRSLGFDVQPNHVMISHCGCGCSAGCADPCGEHPRNADLSELGLTPNPFRANPFRANPFRANPFRANALCGNPFRANPFRANAPMESTAKVVVNGDEPTVAPVAAGGALRVLVLDTGLDDHPVLTNWHRTNHDEDADTIAPAGVLDPVAGHGTFIAGLIAQHADASADVEVVVASLVSPKGDVDEWDVATALNTAAGMNFDVINMSFGGPPYDTMGHLKASVAAVRQAGILMVASAGNEGTSCPQYPAAFPEVVAVGAVDVDGPAEFTNFGSWVDASAPGVDLVSTFFDTFGFNGWAYWSGTSFAAPIVTAELANRLGAGADPDKALSDVLGDSSKPEIPCLGRLVGDLAPATDTS